MGGRQYLLPDRKSFELVFQRLFMVAKIAVGSAHIVVGGRQIRMGGRQYPFPDRKGFELIFQLLFMVTKVVVGTAQVAVCHGQALRVRRILFPKRHCPLIAGQRPP